MTPLFSLVVCTIGRTADLLRLFESLALQEFSSFEVILVDQSDKDDIAQAIEARQFPFPIIHLRSGRGLSLGRNLAMRHLRGSIVSFPDDDCAYPPRTLAEVKKQLDLSPEFSGLSGRSLDFDGATSGPRSPDTATPITTENIWRCAISYTIFLRRNVLNTVGFFDERLGVGSGTPFQSGEETDYLLRALERGCRLQYIPLLVVNHPRLNVPHERDLIAKDFRYAVGMGHVVRKNRLGLRYFMPHLFKPLAGSALSLIRFDTIGAQRYLQRARGRWIGFIGGTGLAK